MSNFPKGVFLRYALSGLLLFSIFSGWLVTTPRLYAASVSRQVVPTSYETDDPNQKPVQKPADAQAAKTAFSNGLIIVELHDAPAIEIDQQVRKGNGSTAARRQAVAGQRAKLAQAQQDLLNRLAARPEFKARTIYRLQNAFNGIALQVNPASIEQIKQLPGVTAVYPLVTYERENAVSVPFIGAPQVWNSFGITGTNIKLGIIDTGIDYTHANFGGPGTPAAFTAAGAITSTPVVVSGTQLYPSPKVAGGYDFAGDAYDAGSATNYIPQPDSNPLDCASSLGGGHGSHVAGTAAGLGVKSDGTTYTGPYTTNLPASNFIIGPGVAPGATLYALRVFGCTGSTSLAAQAIDWVLDPNGDNDFSDHLDVVNLSLGGAYGAEDIVTSRAVDNAAQAGILFAISAGNNGDIHYVSGSPGSAVQAVTVASSTDSISGIYNAVHVNSPLSISGYYSVTDATFGPSLSATGPITGTLYYPATDQDGCNTYSDGNISGKILLIDRGTCVFVIKVKNAQDAGAIAVLVANNQAGIPGMGGTDATINIPSQATTQQTGNMLKTSLASNTVTVTMSAAFRNMITDVVPAQADMVSSFSSRGPTNKSNRLKPDITAPGSNIFSTASGTGNQGMPLNGTSMAAPHIAGSLVLMRQLHPDWTVEEIKALLMNTANHDIWSGQNQTGLRYAPARVGAGRVDMALASNDSVLALNANDPGAVSVSFGAVQASASSHSYTRNVKVVNKSNAAASYTLSYDPYTTVTGVSYSFPGGTNLTVPANGQVSFQVQLDITPGAVKNTFDPTMPGTALSLNEASGQLVLTAMGGGNSNLRLPVYAAIRPASEMTTNETQLVFNTTAASGNVTLSGNGLSGSTYPADNLSLVAPMELSATRPQTTTVGARTANIKAVGVSTDGTYIYFGLATWATWTQPANGVSYNVYIDTNLDGHDDFNLFAARTGSESFISQLNNLNTSSNFSEGPLNKIATNKYNTGIYNNNVLVLPVKISDLGVSGRFNYRVEGFDAAYGNVDVTGSLSYDYTKPGLDFGLTGNPLNASAGTTSPLFQDTPGQTIPFNFNSANFAANQSKGLLLLHFFNAPDSSAQVVPVLLSSTTTLDIQPNPSTNGQVITMTATVSGIGGGTPTGTVAFKEGSTLLGSSSLGGNSAAVFTTRALRAGQHNIVAYYAGDSTFAASQSNPYSQQVNCVDTTVSEASDDGLCGSLTYALNQALVSPAVSVNITFTVPGNVITATNSLPVINTSGKTIQLDAGCNIPQSGRGMYSLEIRGNSQLSGLKLQTGGNSVNGIAFSGFSGFGIDIQSNNNTITCSAAFNNSQGGIRLGTVNGAQASHNQLGAASSPNTGNLIFNNTGVGIQVNNGTDNHAYYNLAGLDVLGAPILPANTVAPLRVAAGGQLIIHAGNRLRR
jgi:subtilisin family serine protease